MCGIAGIYAGASAPPVGERELEAMAAILHHRGPDGFGTYVSPRVGLASARLSIVDLAGGFQPLCSERRDVWLVHNGEIFNHPELRRGLEARGHRFRTRSDSEVIVHLYEDLGPDAWRELNGQFSVALWDRRSSELWLVRDRLGIHPLLYARAGGSVVFGSEAKALFASGRIAPAPHHQGLVDTFARWSPSPPATVFAGVLQVLPGTALRFGPDLDPSERRYWSITFPDAAPASAAPVDGALDATLDTAADALEAALEAAVRLRLRADVPVGAYLSGGLDSALIASTVRRVHTGRLDTFGIRFDEPLFDETDAQRRMATELGTDHHEILCTAADIAAALPATVWHAEQPVVRTAPVPMYLLSGLVAREGFKVAMTGEGSDEWFAGYSIFKEDRIRRFWARRPGSTMRPQLLRRLHPEIGRDRARRSQYWQSFFGQGLADTDQPLYSHLPRWQNAAWATRLLAKDVLAAGTEGASYAAVAAGLPDGFAGWSPLARAQAIEVQTFLSSYLLAAQGDRVSLAHGVELRYPFLDPDVVELATRLPDRLKMLGLRDKLVVRRLASRTLPPEVWRRPKQPYRAPMASVLSATRSSPDIKALLSEEAVRRIGLLDPGATSRLLERAQAADGRAPGEREEMAMIGIVTVQLWGDRYLVGFGRELAATLARLPSTAPRVRERHPDGEPFTAGAVS
jgi:asparagine synthase (glutamine-hydrolysing)